MRIDSSRCTCPTQAFRAFRHRLLVMAALGLLTTGTVTAQDVTGAAPAQTPTAQPTTPPAKSGKSHKVCEYEDVIGTRMKKRICLTPEQWEAREKAAKDFVREMDGKPLPKDSNGG